MEVIKWLTSLVHNAQNVLSAERKWSKSQTANVFAQNARQFSSREVSSAFMNEWPRCDSLFLSSQSAPRTAPWGEVLKLDKNSINPLALERLV
jgi:hypothetical protein